MKETRKGKRKIMRAVREFRIINHLSIEPVRLNTYPDRTVSLVLKLGWREDDGADLTEWIEIPYYKGRSERFIRVDMWEAIAEFVDGLV